MKPNRILKFFLTSIILVFVVIVFITKTHKHIFSYNELTVTFIKRTSATTFIKKGKPVSGTVVQKLRRGGKNIWEVDKGLAVKQTMYYPNGQIRRMLEMKNGVEHGTFVVFYPDGQKRVEQFFENGEPVGTWHRWNKDGELVETIKH